MKKIGLIIIIVLLFIVLLFALIYSLNSSPEEPSQEIKEAVDCGRIESALDDFEEVFFDKDFDQDPALACMGESIKNCSNAESVIDIESFDLSYKTKECNIKFEADVEQGFIWAECPASSLVSFAQEQSADISEFGQILEKMEQGNGDYAASMFGLMTLTLEFDLDTLEQLNCTRGAN